MNVFSIPFLLAALSGWLNRQQQEVVAHLVEENRVWCAQLGTRRLSLTGDERRLGGLLNYYRRAAYMTRED